MSNQRLHSLVALLAACWLGALSLAAAEHHGRVQFGGLPVPGATVTASQGQKKLATISDSAGLYSFPDLPDGVWTVQVEMLCFSTLKREVTVAAGAPASEWELKALPINEIQAESQAPPSPSSQPAASAPPTSAAAALPARSPEPKKKQGREKDQQKDAAAAKNQTGFQRADLNASNNQEANGNAGTADQQSGAFADLSQDELAQRASDGLVINGSNNNSASSPFGLGPAFGNFRKGFPSLYSGNIGFILGNSALDARSYSFTGQDTPKPGYDRITMVGSFGGPLKIPRLVKNGPMVTVNYQWTRNRNATTQSVLMPTAAERDGDFSRTFSQLGKPVTIFDPATGLQFPGNAIPQDRISPQARALLGLYPLPNFAGGTRYNYQVPITDATHQDSLQARVNRGFRRVNQLSGMFAYQSARNDNPNVFGFLDTADSSGLNTSLAWRRNFGPRLFANLGYQYSRSSARTTPFFAGRTNVSWEAGISGNNQEPENWGPPALMFSSGIAGLSDARPSLVRNQTSGVSYGMTWNRERHRFTFGADFRRQQFNYLSQQDPRGSFGFTGASTQARVNAVPVPQTGFDFAGFLLGIPDTSSIAFGNADKYFRSSMYDGYFTDDWRISPALTLNAGVRWEYSSPITEVYGRLVNLDITQGFLNQAPVVGADPVGSLTGRKYPASLIRPDKTGFQPRIGFAWRPFPASSTVVRGGYGVYYNTSVYATIATQMAQQAPLSKSVSVQNSSASPLTLANGFAYSPGITATTYAVDPDLRVGYAHNWQLSVQRDLPAALVAVVVYNGIKGMRGMQQFLPNTFPAGAVNPCPSCMAGYTYLTSDGASTRQSGQLQIRRRLRNGFMASAQYTFSKSIDDSAVGGRNQGGQLIAQDWLDLRAERALSNFDQRHLLALQAQYTTGMGVAGGMLMRGWKAALLKEWTVASQITIGSGLPLTPLYPRAVNGTGVTGSIRPDYTGGAVYDAPSGLFLNPAAFAAPAPGRWGNAGRNSITGPSQFALNASFGRTFRMRDRMSLDLRVDATNALNHVTFPSWNTTVGSAQFGLPVVANPMRSLHTTVRMRF